MKHVEMDELLTSATVIPDPNEPKPEQEKPVDAPAPQPAPNPAPAPQALRGHELRMALRRWAGLIASCELPVELLHGLEYRSPSWLNSFPVTAARFTPFGVAALSGQFPGLSERSSVGDVIRHFDLSAHSVHSFSCDCGGEIDKTDMAQRILYISNAV